MTVDPDRPLAEYERECYSCDFEDTGAADADASCPDCGGKLYITTWTGEYL